MSNRPMRGRSRLGHVLVTAVGIAIVAAACATPTTPAPSSSAPSSRPSATPPPAVPSPSPSPAASASPPLTAADLPELDVAALFGPSAKLTGADDTLPGDPGNIAVLGLTSERFGVAAECIGDGTATVEVTRPIADPSPGGSMYEELASYSLDCPSGGPVILETDFGGPGEASSLNMTMTAPADVYWRAILVDLAP